jgi:hypothetical protein
VRLLQAGRLPIRRLGLGFLRRYAWTLDFDTMTMTLAEPL